METHNSKMINNENLNQTKECYYRPIKYLDENGFQKKKKVLLYCSGEPGTKIRNALTGFYYPNYTVGTKDEYMLYKVRLLKHGKPLIFFFDSPNQYEESQQVTVCDIKKQKWYERRTKIFEKLYP